MTFGAGIQKWAEIPSLWGKQGYGYTEAVEGLGVDIKLQDAMSTAKRNTKSASRVTAGNKTFSESGLDWVFPVQQSCLLSQKSGYLLKGRHELMVC